ncbi:polysaccharide biosynthesis tyrosine autokinase [Kaistia dalseonensis]|uniref:non-specific protein-tyrosine kinase n=1 Tax=Kaistia dalseonensis TaxID=410840 RepID=A0ABU0H318_9HYPH|nr:polysaccharide biosynthesis tyrosine autokinase [Kaistia dalseonensis]MCX5494122.1 polysaccharide biosynthesis tyrosine autokinase [Kaistia dalseonensis]MDQ0436701.1 capsular exopolysaccharide synthesis family protein [Kaistia dalseonensis]
MEMQQLGPNDGIGPDGTPRGQGFTVGSQPRRSRAQEAGQAYPDDMAMSYGGTSGGGFDLRSILGLLRRQIKLIIATILVVNGLAALFIFQLTPTYTASALVMVDPRQKDILDPDGQISLMPSDTGRVESEVGIIRSPSVLLSVVNDLDLIHDPQFLPKPGLQGRLKELIGVHTPAPSPDDVVKRVLSNLARAVSVARQGTTYLIEIAAHSPDPQRAAAIANSVSEKYIEAQIDAKINMAEVAQRKVMTRLDSAMTAVRTAEDKIDRFVDDNLGLVTDVGALGDIASFQRDIDNQEAQRQELSKSAAEIDQFRRAGDWAQLVATVESDQLKALNARRVEIEQTLQQAGNDSEKAINLRAQLDDLGKKMDLEALTAFSQIRASLDAAQRQEEDLRQKRREKIISSLPKDVAVRLYEVQKEADVSRGIYERLLNSAKAIDAQKDLQVADSRVVSAALPPASPSFPNTRMLFALCGLASIGLGLGLAFLRENYIGGFVDEAQTESVLGIPALSSLPSLDQSSGWKSDASIAPNEIVLHPISPYSEAVRRIRLGVDMGRRQRSVGAQTILITSAVPNEGKTQTAVSLARSFALSGKKTLLIDCDLRRPTVSKALGIESSSGLTDYLSGQAKEEVLNELVSTDAATGLSVIVGAAGNRSATDSLLDSARLERLLTLAQEWFDFIVIDSSPLLPVVDARLLLRHATMAVIVIKWAQTSQQEVRAAISDLARVNYAAAPIVAVLNEVEVGSFGYGYRGRYRSYYAEAAS